MNESEIKAVHNTMNDYAYRKFKYLVPTVEEEGGILLILYNMVRGLKPKTVVEIGTGNSHTTSAFIEGLDENNIESSLLYTIDIEPHIPNDILRHPFLISYTGKSDEAFEEWNKTNLIDILYIDGGHHYDQCKRDFDNWSQYVKSDGFILIHDTNNFWWPGVIQCVNEIKQTNKYDMITLPYGWGLTIIQRKNG